MARPEDQDLNQTAASWLVKLQRPDLAPEEREAFQAWVQASAANGVAFARAEALWERTARLSAVRPLLSPPRAALWTRRRLAGVAAASIVGGVLVYRGMSADAYATPIGVRKRIDLADHSHLTLNTASRAEVRYSAHRRAVELLSGEALFEVARDTTRPFTVSTAEARFIAIGTVFNVRLKDDGVELCVVEGTVDCAERGRPPLRLGAGRRALLSSVGQVVETLDADALRARTAWRNGLIELRGETLTEAVAEFARYGGPRIVIKDPFLAGLRVGGTFATTDSSRFVDALQRGFGVTATAGPNNAIYLARRRP